MKNPNITMTADELEVMLKSEGGRLFVTPANADAAERLAALGVVKIETEKFRHGSKRGRPGIYSQFITERRVITFA